MGNHIRVCEVVNHLCQLSLIMRLGVRATETQINAAQK